MCGQNADSDNDIELSNSTVQTQHNSLFFARQSLTMLFQAKLKGRVESMRVMQAAFPSLHMMQWFRTVSLQIDRRIPWSFCIRWIPEMCFLSGFNPCLTLRIFSYQDRLQSMQFESFQCFFKERKWHEAVHKWLVPDTYNYPAKAITVNVGCLSRSKSRLFAEVAWANEPLYYWLRISGHAASFSWLWSQGSKSVQMQCQGKYKSGNQCITKATPL